MIAVNKRRATGLSLVVLAAGIVFTMLVAAGAGAKQSSVLALPRAQTLYMSGNQWSPNNDLNPAKNWDYVTGLVGFVYETPFRYDPLADKFIPWLASGGKWVSKSKYEMTIRKNVKWSDGKSLTASDVKYSFNLANINTHPQHPLWTDTGLKGITASGNKVIFTFGAKPGYQQFDYYRFMVAVVPQHIFKNYSHEDIATGNLDNTKNIVGTGPYLYQSGFGASSESVVWVKNTKWWAIKALGKNVAPKYIVDIKNGTNAAALGQLQAGNIDLFNNFAPKAAIYGKFKTYYAKAPFHQAANTTWMFPNTTHKPLGDAQFRRALAFSINMPQIIDKAYQGLVLKASPTGLLPIWSKWVDTKAVKAYGFSHNASKAKSILSAAGYKDVNGDGYVENKDGSKINLDIVVPNGWSDWMTAIQVISSSAKEVGIHLTPGYPEYGTMADDRGHGELRPASRQRPADEQLAVDVLPVHLQPADPPEPDDNELRAVLGHGRMEPRQDARPDEGEQPSGLPGSDVEPAEDVHAEAAGNSALVQRHVVDGQQPVLDQLAIGKRRALHAHLVA